MSNRTVGIVRPQRPIANERAIQETGVCGASLLTQCLCLQLYRIKERVVLQVGQYTSLAPPSVHTAHTLNFKLEGCQVKRVGIVRP